MNAPHLRRVKPDLPSLEQVFAVVDHLPETSPLRLPFALLVSLGMHPRSICALKCHGITITTGGHVGLRLEHKRAVILPAGLGQELLAHACYVLPKHQDHLFALPDGTPLTVPYLARQWKLIATSYGLQLNAHEVRHVFAQAILSNDGGFEVTLLSRERSKR